MNLLTRINTMCAERWRQSCIISFMNGTSMPTHPDCYIIISEALQGEIIKQQYFLPVKPHTIGGLTYIGKLTGRYKIYVDSLAKSDITLIEKGTVGW